MELTSLNPSRVFYYFEKLCAIPRGSGNMNGISSFCMDFAKAHSLKAIRDDANNVIIFKNASAGYENSEPVILQGHLDMVCQKTADCDIDFEKDAITPYIDGNFIKAKGTTLGGDNGIAVAMIMAILESDTIEHPPIEALFTTDEEIGMIGAMALCTTPLKGKKMINIDAEEPQMLTVSCAGGSDFKITLPLKRETVSGKKIELTLKGLKGGHSGIEINSCRVNSNILAGRILNFAKSICDFEIISIDGGDKGNAIALCTTVSLVVRDDNEFIGKLNDYIETVKKEIADREENFAPSLKVTAEGEYDVLDSASRDTLIFTLLNAPNGVMEMSAVIDGLVETSLNLGILKTEADKITLHFTLRSNKQSALNFLEEKLSAFASHLGMTFEAFGHYPPWEFKNNSDMQKLYKEVYKEKFGAEPTVVAIHAGLECGVFASKIKDLDCIAIGPLLQDVHTVNEKLSISSTQEIFDLILNILKKCK